MTEVRVNKFDNHNHHNSLRILVSDGVAMILDSRDHRSTSQRRKMGEHDLANCKYLLIYFYYTYILVFSRLTV